MATFRPLGRGGFVDPIDRSGAIDFVNRVNWFFDAWDLDAMIDAFDENVVVYHPRGTVRGHAELRRFYDAYYPLVPGLKRHATSHVVDVDADLVTVRYHNLLVRYALTLESVDRLRQSRLADAKPRPAAENPPSSATTTNASSLAGVKW